MSECHSLFLERFASHAERYIKNILLSNVFIVWPMIRDM